MLIKPAEREWLYAHQDIVEGALSVLVPCGLLFGLFIGFTVN